MSEATLVRRQRVSQAFQQVGPAELAQLAVELTPIQLAGGEALFRQGDPGDSLFVVDHGRLAILIRGRSGAETRVSELGGLELVGEGSLLTGAPRSATVVAIRDTALVRLSRDGFQRLVASRPETAIELARKIMRRLQSASGDRPAPRPVSTVAVVRAGSAPAEEELACLLAAEIGKGGEVLVLTSRAVDEALGPGHAQAPASEPQGAETRRWLNDQERSFQLVVYQADPELTSWSRLCVRQADRVLLAARASGDPAPNRLERELLSEEEPLAQRELVLLHDGGARRHASEWLAGRKVFRHHIVSTKGEADVARLGRFLMGTATGVVLGGGGARTFAHLGALRALREAGVPIDALGGCSGGSLFAAQQALDWDLPKMLKETRKGFLESGSLLRLAVPTVSLISEKPFVRLVGGMFGTERIEDLRTPYFCVSTNLTRNRLEVHREGELTTWILASMAVPGLGPPIVRGGDVLVDGCVASILPTPTMRAFGVGTVLGVDVAARTGPTFPGVPDGVAPSGMRNLAGKFRAAVRGKPPSVVDLLLGAAFYGGGVAGEEAAADLVVRPPLDRFGPLDFGAIDAIVAAGYDATRAALEESALGRLPAKEAGAA